MSVLIDTKLSDNLKNICRTCLSQHGSRTSIFNANTDKKLASMLIVISQLQFLNNDGLPSEICDMCITKTNQAYAFIQNIKTADKTLREHHNNLKNGTQNIKFNTIKEESDGISNDEDNTSLYKLYENKNSKDCKINEFKTNKVCPICSESFNTQFSYLRHMKITHQISKPYKCDNCSASYATKNALELHIKSKHTFEHKYSCNLCSKSFIEKRNFNRHIKAHTSSYVCHLCEKSFNFRQSLNIHLQIHQRNEKLSCPQCNLTFLGNYQLKRHIKVSHTGEIHECSHCQKVFTHKTRLRKHLICHMKTIDKRFHCQHCPKKFNYGHHLKNHERIHTGSKPFLCTKCGRSFAQSHNLTLHQRQHDDVLPFACDICKKTFAHPYRLKRHLLTHTGEKPFMCNLCGKQYTDENRLKKHIVSHKIDSENTDESLKQKMSKKDEGKHICDDCGTGYNRPEQLRLHMKRIHSQKHSFACPQCPRKFHQNCELKIHIRRHTGEKPYKCNTCNKAFVNKQSLTTHYRIHTGEKPFKCNICSKAFSSSSSLSNHTKSHSIENETNTLKGLNEIENTDSVMSVDNELQIDYKSMSEDNSKSILVLNENSNYTILESIQNYNKISSLIDASQSLHSNQIMQDSEVNAVPKDNINIIISEDDIANSHMIKNAIRSQDGKYLIQLPDNLHLSHDNNFKIQQVNLKNVEQAYTLLDFGKVIKFPESSVENVFDNEDLKIQCKKLNQQDGL